MAAALVTHKAKNWLGVRLGTQSSFCAAATSTTLPVPQARYRTQSLFSAMRPLLRAGPSGRPKDRDMLLGHQALSDLRWWARLSDHTFLGRALRPSLEDAVVQMDASASGWGAIWTGMVPDRGFYGPKSRHLHINVHELAALRLAVQSLLPLLRNDGTVLRLDAGLNGRRARGQQRHLPLGGQDAIAALLARPV